MSDDGSGLYDLEGLARSYQVAAQLAEGSNAPVAFTEVCINEEPLILALMHPAVYAWYVCQQGSVTDPRSERLPSANPYIQAFQELEGEEGDHE